MGIIEVSLFQSDYTHTHTHTHTHTYYSMHVTNGRAEQYGHGVLLKEVHSCIAEMSYIAEVMCHVQKSIW